MTEFATTELGALAAPEKGSIAIGPFGSRMKADVYTETGVPVIRGTNIGTDKTLKGDWVYVPEEFADEIPNCIVYPGDLVFPHRGSIGEVALVPPGIGRLVLSSSMMKFRADRTKAVPEFLYYYFKSRAGRAEILRFGSQVGTPGIGQPLTSLKRFVTPLPKPEVQAEIARLLTSLDDKIELNRRMNETLEEMARALFRDWFTGFGPTRRQAEGATDPAAIMGHAFPREKAATLASLFPTKFGDDGLPEGWEKQPVGELAEVVGGGTPNTKTEEFWEGGTHLWATPRDLSKLSGVFISDTERKLTDAGLAKVSSGLSPTGSVLMSSRAPIGYLAIASQPVAVNQGFIVMRPSDQFPTQFAKLWCEANMETIEANANGSTFQEISKKNFKPILATVPTAEVMAAFSNVAGLLFEKVQANEQENQTLAEMRDLLLPKLMSGDIRLKDGEEVQPSEVAKPTQDFATDLLGDQFLSPEQEEERDAVIVAATVKALQKDDLFVGNVRVMKGVYLLKRKQALSLAEFQREAAGPYDRALNHEIRGYARERSWIRETKKINTQGSRIPGNQPASKYSEVEPLIDKYDLGDSVDWLAQHFNGASKEWMECVATVDVAVQELTRKGLDVTVANIKADIASDPTWKPKLAKDHFTDIEIRRAVKKLGEIL